MTDSAADELAIRSLVARCMLAFDHEDEDAWIECWTEDATFEVPGKLARGHDELRRLFRQVARPIHHMTADSVVVLDGDRAAHSSSLAVFVPTLAGPHVRTHGFYADEVVRTDTGWRFAARTMTPMKASPAQRSARPRVPPLAESPVGLEEMFVSSRFDRVLNVTGTLARSPKMAERFHELGAYFVRTELVPPRARELIILRMAWRTCCQYEFGVHVVLGRAAGLTDGEIERTAAVLDPAHWSSLDLAVLRMTDELWRSDDMTDETWADLARNWSEAAIVELVVLAGFFRMSDAFLNALRVQLEPDLPRGSSSTAAD